MILEVAILNIKPGQEDDFEKAFKKAQEIIIKMVGYQSHQLQHSIENKSRYILLVNWDSLENHEIGFRQSEEYKKWLELLHHFYDPFPSVEHFTSVYSHSAI